MGRGPVLRYRSASRIGGCSSDGILSAEQLDKAKQILEQLRQSDTDFRRGAYTKLRATLATWNEPKSISEEEFVRRLKFVGLGICTDGTLSLEYDSGGLFTDHHLTLELSAKGNLISAIV